MAEPSVGEVIDGRYEIEALIGRGGMGTVWRARHVFTNVRVALKLIEQEYDAVAFDRFLAEARAASTIGHPAIVVVSDANRMANNQLYLAMELLAGKPLRVAMSSGAVGGEETRRIGLELLDAIAAAHRRGIIHRDLKPENIFLVAPTGSVKVLDFGIAKVLGGSSRTKHDGVLGTIEYMAPEQLADATDIDGRADLWAVGIVLYEMIAALRPFGGKTPYEKYLALMNEDPIPIDTIVPAAKEITAFFAKALARERTRRFASAADMAGALRGLVFSTTVGAAPSAGPTLGTGDAWLAPRPPSIPPADPLGPTHRATPQSIPPPDEGASPTRRPQPNRNLGTDGTPRAAPRKRSSLPFVIGGVVIAAAVTIGVVAGSRGDSEGHEAGSDAAVVVRAPSSDARTVVSGDRCKNICNRLAACQLAQTRCIDDCERQQMRLSCIESTTDCVGLAACVWQFACAGPAAGNTSCSTALRCQTDCGVDGACRCLCVRSMKPQSALLMARLFLCQADTDGDNQKFMTNCFHQFVPACTGDL